MLYLLCVGPWSESFRKTRTTRLKLPSPLFFVSYAFLSKSVKQTCKPFPCQSFFINLWRTLHRKTEKATLCFQLICKFPSSCLIVDSLLMPLERVSVEAKNHTCKSVHFSASCRNKLVHTVCISIFVWVCNSVWNKMEWDNICTELFFDF